MSIEICRRIVVVHSAVLPSLFMSFDRLK